MTAAYVNSYMTDNSSVRTSVPVVAGELIVVSWVDSKFLYSATCADNAGGGSNVYKEAGSGVEVAGSNSSAHVFYAIAKASETLTITVTPSLATVYPVIIVNRFSGCVSDINSVLDAVATKADIAAMSAHQSATVKTSTPESVLFALWSQNDVAAVTTPSGAFTKSNSDGGIITDYQIVSVAGEYSDAVTNTGGITHYDSLLVAFKAIPTTYTPVVTGCSGFVIGGGFFVMTPTPPSIGSNAQVFAANFAMTFTGNLGALSNPMGAMNSPFVFTTPTAGGSPYNPTQFFMFFS